MGSGKINLSIMSCTVEKEEDPVNLTTCQLVNLSTFSDLSGIQNIILIL
jgi:hypothetical protein